MGDGTSRPYPVSATAASCLKQRECLLPGALRGCDLACAHHRGSSGGGCGASAAALAAASYINWTVRRWDSTDDGVARSAGRRGRRGREPRLRRCARSAADALVTTPTDPPPPPPGACPSRRPMAGKAVEAVFVRPQPPPNACSTVRSHAAYVRRPQRWAVDPYMMIADDARRRRGGIRRRVHPASQTMPPCLLRRRNLSTEWRKFGEWKRGAFVLVVASAMTTVSTRKLSRVHLLLREAS